MAPRPLVPSVQGVVHDRGARHGHLPTTITHDRAPRCSPTCRSANGGRRRGRLDRRLEGGDGPPLVLLHGPGPTPPTGGEVLPALVRRPPRDRARPAGPRASPRCTPDCSTPPASSPARRADRRDLRLPPSSSARSWAGPSPPGWRSRGRPPCASSCSSTASASRPSHRSRRWARPSAPSWPTRRWRPIATSGGSRPRPRRADGAHGAVRRPRPRPTPRPRPYPERAAAVGASLHALGTTPVPPRDLERLTVPTRLDLGPSRPRRPARRGRGRPRPLRLAAARRRRRRQTTRRWSAPTRPSPRCARASRRMPALSTPRSGSPPRRRTAARRSAPPTCRRCRIASQATCSSGSTRAGARRPRSGTRWRPLAPALVVQPASAQDVAAVVDLAAARGPAAQRAGRGPQYCGHRPCSRGR